MRWMVRGIATLPEGIHVDSATPGLRLVVSANAGGRMSRRWMLRYRCKGNRRDASLGTQGKVGLKASSKKAGEMRALLDVGTDPIEDARQRRAPGDTFASIAASYVRLNRASWTRLHAREWVRSLRLHAGALRNVPVSKITFRQVAEALAPAWKRQHVTAKRVAGRIDKTLWRAVGLSLIDT